MQVGKLEQRLLSLQTAHALRCSTCRPLLTRQQDLERRLTQLLAERRGHLQDLAQMKYVHMILTVNLQACKVLPFLVQFNILTQHSPCVFHLRASHKSGMEKSFQIIRAQFFIVQISYPEESRCLAIVLQSFILVSLTVLFFNVRFLLCHLLSGVLLIYILYFVFIYVCANWIGIIKVHFTGLQHWR